MSRLTSAVGVGLAIGTALVTAMPTGIAGQHASKPAKGWTVPRTPDGQPDFQGYWTNDTFTPLERPPELAGKEFFTEAGSRGISEEAPRSVPGAAERRHPLRRCHLAGENYDKEPNRRTSLIRRSARRKLPPLTAEAGKRAAARAAAREGGSCRQRAEPLVWPSAAFPGVTSGRRCFHRPTTPTCRSCRRATR